VPPIPFYGYMEFVCTPSIFRNTTKSFCSWLRENHVEVRSSLTACHHVNYKLISISSIVIQHLQAKFALAANSIVVYYYFDFKTTSKQKVNSCLSSLLGQICNNLPRIPSSIERAYSRNTEGASHCTTDELKALLFEALAEFEQLYIVIDALDECSSPDRESLLIALSDMKNAGLNNLHLLVTSRQEQDIDEGIRPLLSGSAIRLQGAELDRDIQKHVQWQLTVDPRLNKWSSVIKLEIEQSLAKGANGM
jgi:hypothetical protein